MQTAFPGINGTTIGEVRKRCGPDIAARLVDQFGGRVVFIPQAPPREAGRLKAALGEDALATLCAAVGGQTLVVPIGRNSALRRMRNQVEELLSLTPPLSVSEVAQRAGCCRRTVYGIKAEMRAAGELPEVGR